MKTAHGTTWILVLASLMLSACESDKDDSPDPLGSVTIDLSASTLFEVPAVTGSGEGSGSITLNRDSGALSGSLTVSGLTGPVTGAHIHEGAAGLTGGIVVTLETNAGNAAQLDVPAGTTLSAAQMADLLAARYYVNVHTAANTSGEVRAQILPAGYRVSRVTLSGDYEAPTPVTTGNSAIGYLTIDTAGQTITGNVRNSGLDDADGVHLHEGFAGETGGIQFPLTRDAGDVALWTLDRSSVDVDELDTLLNGGFYFNVHSPAFGDGEVRGQVATDNVIVTRSLLDGAQQVPANASSASGIGYSTLNTDDGSIVANVRVSGLTVESAHIHKGAIGVNGAVVLALTEDPTDSDFWSVSGQLNAAQQADFLADALYFNVHSATFIYGEIRGQITP